MEDISLLERELFKCHQAYSENIKKIFPGSSYLNDNYCKAISMILQNDQFIKSPEDQYDHVKQVLELFENKDEAPKLLHLYCDYLQFNQLKDMENRNTPKEVKELLLNHFIQKFFQLNNKKDKVIARANCLLNNLTIFQESKESLDILNNKHQFAHNNRSRHQYNRMKKQNSSLKMLGQTNIIDNNFSYDPNEVKNFDNLSREDKHNFTNENIFYIKAAKVKRLNAEIEFTLKRILRLLEDEDIRSKDFEYYLKHFKLKKLDTIFLKKDQTDMHYNLRKDDFEIYLREVCYRDKLFYQIRNFEPNLKFVNLKSGYDIWKTSKTFLKNLTENFYNSEIKKLDMIYKYEKSRCSAAEKKIFKEYFKSKYKYFYLLREQFESKDLKTRLMHSYINDIFYPPLIITINSEIKYFLKELCEHYNLEFDISIDKGKAYYYYLDGKIPEIFSSQKHYFTYNLYELKEFDYVKKDNLNNNNNNPNSINNSNPDNSNNNNNKNSIIGVNSLNNFNSTINNQHQDDEIYKLENKVTDILRDKYNIKEGFNVHSEYNMSEINLRNSTFKSEIFKKKANWLEFICIYPRINQKYISNKRKMEAIGYIDSMLIYEFHLIGEVDLNTLNRLVEDYTLNFKSRNKKNLKLLTTKLEETEYSSLRNLVKDVIETKEKEEISTDVNGDVLQYKKIMKKVDNNISEEDYADKINLDLLRYFLMLRFLKIRDVKFWIINILNYFRFIQKKFVIDLYKIENKNWKKAKDYDNLIYILNEYPGVKAFQNEDESCEKNKQNSNTNNYSVIQNQNHLNNEKDNIDQTLNAPISHEKSLIEKDTNNMNILDKTNPLLPTYDIFMSINKKHNKNIINEQKKRTNMDITKDKLGENNNNNNSSSNRNVKEGKRFIENIMFDPPCEDNFENNKAFQKVLFDEVEESVEFINEKLVRIKDSRGNYIMYDATISDMEQLELELGKTGTYYINKREELIIDVEKTSNPLIDRSQVILDLFTKEFEFLHAKVEYINQLLFCYDSVTDIVMQKALIQYITDLIAQRPLLDLNFYYFSESYILETEILRKKTLFLKKIIYNQIKLEIEENKTILEKNDRLYWLLGQCALDFIQHIRLDKLDIHLLKEFINQKRMKIENKNYKKFNSQVNNNETDKNNNYNRYCEKENKKCDLNLENSIYDDVNKSKMLPIENEINELENFIAIFEKLIENKEFFDENIKRECLLNEQKSHVSTNRGINNDDNDNKYENRDNNLPNYSIKSEKAFNSIHNINEKMNNKQNLVLDNEGNFVDQNNSAWLNNEAKNHMEKQEIVEIEAKNKEETFSFDPNAINSYEYKINSNILKNKNNKNYDIIKKNITPNSPSNEFTRTIFDEDDYLNEKEFSSQNQNNNSNMASNISNETKEKHKEKFNNEKAKNLEQLRKKIDDLNILNALEIIETEAHEKNFVGLKIQENEIVSSDLIIYENSGEANKRMEKDHKAIIQSCKRASSTLLKKIEKYDVNPKKDLDSNNLNINSLEKIYSINHNNFNAKDKNKNSIEERLINAKAEERADKKYRKVKKIYKELNFILNFMRKIFYKTLIMNDENSKNQNNKNPFSLNYLKISDLEEEDINRLSDLDLIENYGPVKAFLEQNDIAINENSSQSRRFYALLSKNSQSILKNNIEVINFQIRSLLNIPNPYRNHNNDRIEDKNFILKSCLKSEINFTKFTEGFPMKILSEYDSEDFLEAMNLRKRESSYLKSFDFFESLNVIVPLFSIIEDAFAEIKASFKCENFLSSQALELCLYENYIYNWEEYKEIINGNRKNSDYDCLFYLNNTLLNDPQNMIYLVKSLLATLSNTANRIPKQILAKLPIQILEKIEIDLIQFKSPSENLNILDVKNIDDIRLEELNDILTKILKKDISTGWINIANSKNVTEVKFFCNLLELYRTKQLIERLINYCNILTNVYDKQKDILLSIKDNLLTFKKPLNLEHQHNLESAKNFVDNHYYYNNILKIFSEENNIPAPRFLITEFEPTFQYCLNFHDLLTCQMNLLDAGFYEVKTFAQYQYMQYYLLMIGVQYNYNFLHEAYLHNCELDLLENNRLIIFNSSLGLDQLFDNLEESKFNTHILRMRSKVNMFINKLGREFFYNIIDRKFQQREFIEKKYHSFLEGQINISSKGYTTKRTLSRHYRLVYTNAYCKEKMMEVYLDSIKLQACKASKVLKDLLKMIPKEYNIFDVNNLNFIENENKIFNYMNKNFIYFNDKKTAFNTFYVPSDIEILRLEAQSSSDRIFHYSQYQPMYRNEEINSPQFFSQINDFFKSPTLKNSVEPYRNKFFAEAISYQSNALCLLQFTQFFTNIINFQFMEMALNEKSEDLGKLIELNENGVDFWGDKKLITPLNANVEENKLPLHIIETIINDEKNYMNLRLNFDKFKIEFESILENIKSYIRNDEDNKKPIIYMQSYTEIITNFWLFICYRTRENCIKSNDFNSSVYLSRIIKTIKNSDYFKPTICGFSCHINESFLRDAEDNKFNFYNPGMVNDLSFKSASEKMDNNKKYSNTLNNTIIYNNNIIRNNQSPATELANNNNIPQAQNFNTVTNTDAFIINFSNTNSFYSNRSFNMKNIFMKSLSFHNKGSGQEELEQIKNNFFRPTVSFAYLQTDHFSFYQKIKYDFLFLSERRFGEIRNLFFKMNSIVEKYMIYLEINRNNTDYIEINKRKLNFYEIYVKLCEFKYKLYIILYDKILNFNGSMLENFEKNLQDLYSDIIPNDNLEDLNEKIINELVEQIKPQNKELTRNISSVTPLTSQQRPVFSKLGTGINTNFNINVGENNHSGVVLIPKINFANKKNSYRRKTSQISFDSQAELQNTEKEKILLDENYEELKHKQFLRGKSTEILKAKPRSGIRAKMKTSRKSSLIFQKLMEAQTENVILEDVLLDNKLVENNIKLEQHILIEYLLKGSKLLFEFYRNQIKSFLLKKGINTLRRETSAMIELFNNSKNDLDINKFQNQFSCSLLKSLDDLHYTSINRKFSFFETFFNKIQNISLEVETHTVSNALIITKYEFENSIKNLIRDFVIFDVNNRNYTSYTNYAENFGLFAKLKKQEHLINILREKLKDYDNNFEKICNAKLALQGNRTIYEMDNLYRQIKILKDNISVMEEYMKTYFEEKFKQIIRGLNTQSGMIENKFQEFKENIVRGTIQNITEEYNDCLLELKSKHLFLTEAAKSLSETPNLGNMNNGDEEENSFFEHFNREMEIETNYNREINRERKKNDNLYEDISKLHAYYRMKLHHQKCEYEKHLAELNQKLSSNQDLWDKLTIAEKNEKILKEELSKTQKSLAYAEEFNKKLQMQIRKSHDTNTNLEKQLSLISANQIINNAAKGENIKAFELHQETKNVYFYNMKNNPALVGAIERLKKFSSNEDNNQFDFYNIYNNSQDKTFKNSTNNLFYMSSNNVNNLNNNFHKSNSNGELNLNMNSDIKIILDNLETLHLKYRQEIDNKRNFVNMLNKLKDDVKNMQEINRLNMEEANKKTKFLSEQLNRANLDIEIFKKNCINVNHEHSKLYCGGNNNFNSITHPLYASMNSNQAYSNALNKNFYTNNEEINNNVNCNNILQKSENIISNSGDERCSKPKFQKQKNNLALIKSLHSNKSNNNLNDYEMFNYNNNSLKNPYSFNSDKDMLSSNENNNNVINYNIPMNSLNNSVTSKNNFGMIHNPMNTSSSNNNMNLGGLSKESKSVNKSNKSKNIEYPNFLQIKQLELSKNTNFTTTSANFYTKQNELLNKQNKAFIYAEHGENGNVNVNTCSNPIINTNALQKIINVKFNDVNENKAKSSRANLGSYNKNILTSYTNSSYQQQQNHTVNGNNIVNDDKQIDNLATNNLKIVKPARLGLDLNTDSSQNSSMYIQASADKNYFNIDNPSDMNNNQEELNVFDTNKSESQKNNNFTYEKNMRREAEIKSSSNLMQVAKSIIADK